MSALKNTQITGSEEPLELRKPHEMIVMMPRSARVTLTGRRIYTALLQIAQTRLVPMPTMPAADFMFEAPLAAVLRTTGSSGSERTAAKRYLLEMRSLEVDWESTAPGDGVKWRGFSMLSEVALEVRRGENWVSWSYPPTIMSALREPQRWATIDLEVLGKLGSYTAVALYEICVRYRDNPSGVTSRKPVAWWVDALSNGPGPERREWRKFKNERVKDAVLEINTETELEIELIEHKQGRTINEVQFAVRKKRVAVLPQPAAAEPVDANLIFRAETLGIREIKLEGLIKEFGDDRVREQIAVLERRAASKNLRSIENAFSYLRSLLRNGSEEVEPPAIAPASPSVQEEPPTRPAQPLASDKSSWLRERIEVMKQEVAALDATTLQKWVNQALQDLARKGALNAVISRRAAQGDVLHGLLGSAVIYAYADATYGPDWKVDRQLFDLEAGK
ncbi:Protein involved in initiation of plasmid replication [Variovorax sp. HW608]|uniref:RepB family plasmid replication initiator protein n=1 Tax=Variovorax sp. HW608 TaxID=1034889 RepID=UPI00081FADB5|nr:RepB family plasmid replication initiator protein [Variovorax sp. HW608]SCK09321.1 Protein involved in initiation of plasmid replication [Variovorax sp. HW608]